MNLPKFDRTKLKLVTAKLAIGFDRWFFTSFREFACDCVRVAFMLGLFCLFVWILSSPAPATGETTGVSFRLSYSLASEGPYTKTVILILYGIFVCCFGLARKLRFSFHKDATVEDKSETETKESAGEAVNPNKVTAPAKANASKTELESHSSQN